MRRSIETRLVNHNEHSFSVEGLLGEERIGEYFIQELPVGSARLIGVIASFRRGNQVSGVLVAEAVNRIQERANHLGKTLVHKELLIRPESAAILSPLYEKSGYQRIEEDGRVYYVRVFNPVSG